LALIVVAAIRFVSTHRLLDDQDIYPAASSACGADFSVGLALMAAGFGT
jgi:hypothetical protein